MKEVKRRLTKENIQSCNSKLGEQQILNLNFLIINKTRRDTTTDIPPRANGPRHVVTGIGPARPDVLGPPSRSPGNTYCILTHPCFFLDTHNRAYLILQEPAGSDRLWYGPTGIPVCHGIGFRAIFPVRLSVRPVRSDDTQQTQIKSNHWVRPDLEAITSIRSRARQTG